MPYTAQDILSKSQSAVGDLSMERIQRGEWISMFNDVTVGIASKTEIWISRFITVPNPVASPWVTNTNYTLNMIVASGGVYYICISAHTSSSSNKPPNATYWTAISQWSAASSYSQGDIVQDGSLVKFYRALTDVAAGTSLDDDSYWIEVYTDGNEVNVVTLPYSFNSKTLAPFKVLRVARKGEEGWTEVNEYSQQAIGTTTGGNYSFAINKTMLDINAVSTGFVDALGNTDGSITFTFAVGFESGEELVIDYISGRPFELALWRGGTTPDPVIPDFLGNSYEYGLIMKAMERLYLSGDDSIANRYAASKNLYNLHLREAVGYAKMLRSTKQSIRIQPMNFLDENYKGR